MATGASDYMGYTQKTKKKNTFMVREVNPPRLWFLPPPNTEWIEWPLCGLKLLSAWPFFHFPLNKVDVFQKQRLLSETRFHIWISHGVSEHIKWISYVLPQNLFPQPLQK